MEPSTDRPGSSAPPPHGANLDRRYLAFFDRFNAGEYFEAHDVLEHLWLEVRRQPVGDFYKGLIQLAGAFVHVRKGRPQPALALLDLADVRLRPYPDQHAGLDLASLRQELIRWRRIVVDQGATSAWLEGPLQPRLHLR